MGWKKKEKPLTPEEAIAQAKKELAPFWFGSEPLLAAIRTESGASAFPLNPGFVKTPWLFSFVDPTEYAGERAILVTREWHRRYSPHQMGFILVFRAPEAFVRSAPDLLRKFQVQFPATCDPDNLLAQSLGIQAWPGVVVQDWRAGAGHGEIARGSGAEWLTDVEEKVQVFLRKSDPGLSLSIPYAVEDVVVGQSRVDFGTVRGKPISQLTHVLELHGQWKETENYLSTNDPTAFAIVSAPTPIFSLIAQSSIETQITKILIESAEGALMQEWVPEGTGVDESGRAVARVQLFGLYNILQDLPAKNRRVKLTFPDADTVPIHLFGMRFGAR